MSAHDDQREKAVEQGANAALDGHKSAGAMISAEMLNFLHGRAQLDGVWFGDRHPRYLGTFWWRRLLPHASTPQVER